MSKHMTPYTVPLIPIKPLDNHILRGWIAFATWCWECTVSGLSGRWVSHKTGAGFPATFEDTGAYIPLKSPFSIHDHHWSSMMPWFLSILSSINPFSLRVFGPIYIVHLSHPLSHSWPWSPHLHWIMVDHHQITIAPWILSHPSQTTLPSGKRLHNYRESSCFTGKSTISMAMFQCSIAFCMFTRGLKF